MKNLFLFIFLSVTTFCFSQNIQQKTDQNDYLIAENYYREGEYEKATQLFKKLYDKSSFNTTYLTKKQITFC